MKKGIILGIVIIIVIVAVFAFNRLNNKEKTENEEDSENGILAGNISLYKKFTQEEYSNALNENKVILLYFYANWCPICRAEQPETFSAFNSLDKENIVGFRVNYKDSDTDADEQNLAKEFGVPYQHTKVILSNGKQVLKSLEGWNKDRYLEELGKFN